jgi:hypothetical protein
MVAQTRFYSCGLSISHAKQRPSTAPQRGARVRGKVAGEEDHPPASEVANATGWQRHTVRGVFSGTLKKKLGLTIASAKEERGRVYRINGSASL